jgi:hypothetical protein
MIRQRSEGVDVRSEAQGAHCRYAKKRSQPTKTAQRKKVTFERWRVNFLRRRRLIHLL